MRTLVNALRRPIQIFRLSFPPLLFGFCSLFSILKKSFFLLSTPSLFTSPPVQAFFGVVGPFKCAVFFRRVVSRLWRQGRVWKRNAGRRRPREQSATIASVTVALSVPVECLHVPICVRVRERRSPVRQHCILILACVSHLCVRMCGPWVASFLRLPRGYGKEDLCAWGAIGDWFAKRKMTRRKESR